MNQKLQGFIVNLIVFQSAHKFVFLFVGLLFLLLLAPIFEGSNFSREIYAIIMTLIIFSALCSFVDMSRWLFILALFLCGINFFTLWWEYVFWSSGAALVHYSGLIIFFIIVIIFIIGDIHKQEKINRNVIFGAVTVYLLIAYIWGYLFSILFILQPGSFRNVVMPSNNFFSPFPFWYVSFLVLTTLGFSDVAPASGLAKSLAMIEGVIGQLYLILQVSLLVGLRASEVAAKRLKKD